MPEPRILLTVLILLYASLQDWTRREVGEGPWLGLLFIGLLYQMATPARGEAVAFGISILTTALLMGALHRLGLLGGGDAKVLVGLSAVFPRPPEGVYTLFPTLALSAFTNALFLTSLLPILFLLKNLKEGLSPGELYRAVLGYRKRAADMRPYEALLEKGGGLKALYDIRGARLGQRPDTEGVVWVTPAIPFLIPLTLGFLMTLLWGDVISYIILRV